MCQCNPEIKAIFCGKPGCEYPQIAPEPLYALLLSDGRWAQICTRNGHGPSREVLEGVDNINQATAMQRYRWRKWEESGVLVPVKETRTVAVITGNPEVRSE